MSDRAKHVSVCICTFKRPNLLQRLLNGLDVQQTGGMFTYSVVVADNDRAQSAREVVSEYAARASVRVIYCVEPVQNIARARNRALSHACGDFIAFIDDDELPEPTWLASLFKVCSREGVAGVLGPVKPCFEAPPPNWVTRGKLFERPTHETGYRIGLSEARTGNVLFRSEILEGISGPFRPEFGTGGEDVDFFQRMMKKGRVFVWCDEAPVYEAIPSSRCSRAYLLRRALLRGSMTARRRTNLVQNVIKSLIAVPAYAMVLPPLFAMGCDHLFMTYLIKFCDHAGRLLALMGLEPVKGRDA